jgi:ferredoxin
MSVRIAVDRDLCQGHAMCVSEAPGVFELGKHDDQVTVVQTSPSDSARESVGRAIAYCPTGALSVEED